MSERNQRISGFTLIELMVTLAIAAVLMLVAIPSLTTFRRNAELTSITNTLVASINSARTEALKRGLSAMVVPVNNGSLWTTGWVVFVDTDVSRAYEAANDSLVFTQAAPPSFINIVGTGPASGATPKIRFDPSGYPVTSAGNPGNFTLTVSRTDVPSTETPAETRLIIAARTGRVRVCKPSSGSDPACNSTLPE